MCAHGLQLDQRETVGFLKLTLIPVATAYPRSRAPVPISRSSRDDQPFRRRLPGQFGGIIREDRSRDSTMEVTCNSQDLTLRNRASDELTTVRHHIAAHLPVIGPNGHKRS